MNPLHPQFAEAIAIAQAEYPNLVFFGHERHGLIGVEYRVIADPYPHDPCQAVIHGHGWCPTPSAAIAEILDVLGAMP